jgi:hypothetical protein
MVELNTIMIVGLIGFGVGALVTIAMVLLYMAYNNINVVMDRTEKKDDEDEQAFAIPMSALGGMGGVSMADIQRAAAQVRAQGGVPGAPVEAPKAAEATGNYI